MPTKSALLVIDLQGYVGDGFHDVRGVLANVTALLANARAEGVPVVWVQHEESGMEPGTPQWQLLDGLNPLPGEVRIYKTYRDSFADTPLGAELEALGVDHLVLTGAQSDFCVRTAAQSAAAKGYSVTLVGDAHTTEDFVSDGTIKAADIVSHVNSYFAGLRYPNVTVEVKPAAKTTFVGGDRPRKAEVRAILDATVDQPEGNFLLALHAGMSEVGGVDLPLQPRKDRPRPVDSP